MKMAWKAGIVSVAAVCVLSVGAQAVIELHWAGLGSGIGGYYNAPPTSGVGYGLDGYHGYWSCEIAFDPVSGIPGIADGSSLITFCLEWNEPTIGENDFYAVLNTGAVKGGIGGQTLPDFDPLSDTSAWLFDQYLDGNTFGIAEVNRRAAVVQEAIWSYEDELDPGWSWYAETAGVKALADAAVSGGWTNQNIRVLNMTWQSDGREAQDVLVRIPEPATLVVLTLGGLLLRRKK